MNPPIKKSLKKHRRNLSYDDAATVSEVWVIAKHFSRSFYFGTRRQRHHLQQEWQRHPT